MRTIYPISSIELLSLLTSKICHDLISPIGAINNGVELFEDNMFPQDAIQLIKKGAENASSKLQFIRLAFGAIKNIEHTIDTKTIENVATPFFASEKLKFSWEMEDCALPKIYLQLLLQVLLIANASLIKGGTLSVSMQGSKENPIFSIHCSGVSIKIPTTFLEIYETNELTEKIDTRTVQIYYTFLIAEEASMKITLEIGAEAACFSIQKR